MSVKSAEWHTEQRRYNFVRIWTKRYAHMKARHEGRSTNFSHSNGKGLMTREEFFIWCKQPENLDMFLVLYYDWSVAEFPISLSPSIDRINPDLGYVAGNIQWLSFEKNCEKNHKYIDPISKKMVRENVL